MAGTIWITGAERLPVSAAGGTITSTAPPRAVWHTVEAPAGTREMWTRIQKVLTDKSAEPQVLYDPLTDWLGQFIPLNLSGRALKNDGTTKTNRTGRVCIQIEVMGYAAKPFTTGWKPGPNFRALMAALRSWGIPEVWPSGPPPKFIADPPHNVPEDERSRTIWLSKAGHYSHSQIPGNTHGDPGGIDTAALFTKGINMSDITDAHIWAKRATEQVEAAMSRVMDVPAYPAPDPAQTGDAYAAHYWAKRASTQATALDVKLGELGFPQ